jgi:hypothetical protein
LCFHICFSSSPLAVPSQTTTFEAERQAFYDNEQHLKSRIQSLSQARRHPAPRSPSVAPDPESEAEPDEEDDMVHVQTLSKPDNDDHDNEPAEMTALRLELSTLSTSYNSMQNTLVLLQTQLVDLKRVNNELQEENESYNILLRERTLNGQFDLFRQVGGVPGSNNSEQGEEDDSMNNIRDDDTGSLRSNARSALDPVDEAPEGGEMDPQLTFDLDLLEADSSVSSRRRTSRHNRNKRGGSTSHSPTRGESLANLPITGPGLDLAAELGRAENKDILEGRAVEDRDHSVLSNQDKRDKKQSTDRKMSSDASAAKEPRPAAGHDIDALRTEVKALKDANKALSLYASKIIDRIISQEGFERVLAIDYEKEATPTTPSLPLNQAPASKSPPQDFSRSRSQSTTLGRSSSLQSPLLSPTERLTTFESISSLKPTNSPSEKLNRRSMSFDWNNFNIFGGSGEKKPEVSTNLRPLTLKPGGSSLVVSGARKLDTEEDDDDRRERERLAATMKLMGIEKPVTLHPHPPIMEKSQSAPSETPSGVSSRFSFFRRKSITSSAISSDASSTTSARMNFASPNLASSKTNLTQEALEQAEAENGLAALDAHERSLSMELAKGSGGGFTEIPKSGRRSRRSAGGSGSGSTVWSAGFTD